MVLFTIRRTLAKHLLKTKVVYHVIWRINVPLHRVSIAFPVNSRRFPPSILLTSLILSHSDIPTSVFGDRLKTQVSDRLKFYDSGELPAKNVDVMQLALQEAEVEREQIIAKDKKRKKKEKKRRKEAEGANGDHANGDATLEQAVNNMEVA